MLTVPLRTDEGIRVLSYHLTPTFRRAIQHAPQSQRALAQAADLTPSQVAQAIGGLRFGPVVKARFETIARELGVPLSECFREVRR